MAESKYMSLNLLRPDEIEAGQQQLIQGRNKLAMQPLEMEAAKQKLEMGKQQMEGNDIDHATKKLDYSIATLGRVNDQRSYDIWRKQMNDMGVDTAGDPDVFDPNWKQEALMGAVSMKDKLVLAKQQQDQKLQLEQFDETKRSNLSKEAIMRAKTTGSYVDPDTGDVIELSKSKKSIPVSAGKEILANRDNLSKAENALALVSGESVGEAKGDKEATGWKGNLPAAILNRVDPSGVDARAAIADLGSMVIHDRSGAAVSASEYPRLAPFIPTATDDAATVKKKLTRFVSEYKRITSEIEDFYDQSGYEVPKSNNEPAVNKLNGAQGDIKTPKAGSKVNWSDL